MPDTGNGLSTKVAALQLHHASDRTAMVPWIRSMHRPRNGPQFSRPTGRERPWQRVHNLGPGLFVPGGCQGLDSMVPTVNTVLFPSSKPNSNPKNPPPARSFVAASYLRPLLSFTLKLIP